MKKDLKQNETKDKKIKHRRLNKKRLFLIVLVLTLIIGISIFIYDNYFVEKESKIAEITNIDGTVYLYRQNAKMKVKNGLELRETDIIEIEKNSSALIILYGRILINLEPKTKVELKSLIKSNLVLKQDYGSTWNKYFSMVGVNYKVETGNAVAMVRGTSFKVEYINGTTQLLTEEGVVDFGDQKHKKYIQVKALEKAFLHNGKLERKRLSQKDKNEILTQKKRIIRRLRRRREQLLKKHQFLVNTIGKQFNLDANKIDYYLKLLDDGKIDINHYVDKIPLHSDSVNEFVYLTNHIKTNMQNLNQLQVKFNQTK